MKRTAQESSQTWPSVRQAPPGAPNLVIIVLDDVGLGYVLCLFKGVPHCVVNYLGRDHYVVAATTPVPVGISEVDMVFLWLADDSSTVTLSVDGKLTAKGRIPRTNPLTFGPRTLGLHVGSDGTGVWPACDSPFTFSGKIHRVTILTDLEQVDDSETGQRIRHLLEKTQGEPDRRSPTE